MTPDDADRLMADFLAGTLDAAGEERLARLLKGDPERVRELASMSQLDGALRAMGEETRPELLLRQIEERLKADPRMVDRIFARIESTPGPGAPEARPAAHRRPLRFHPAEPRSRVPWAVLAACAFFGLVALVASIRKPAPAPVPPGVVTPPSALAGPPAPPPPEAPEVPAAPQPSAPAPLPAIPPEAPRVPVPEPAPPPAPPVPPPSQPPAPRTVVAVADLERVQGDVRVVSDGAEAAARAGTGLVPEQGVRTFGPESAAVLKYSDGTRIHVGAETRVERLLERPGGGKTIVLARGQLAADVQRQPAGQPLLIATPLAEAVVLGTRFTLTAGASVTRLEVREGKVRLTRLPDRKAADVSAGHFAIAAPRGDLAARALPAPPAAGIVFWLRAGAGSAPPAPTADARPALVEDAAAGWPAFRFDGTDDCFSVPAGFRDFTRGLTAFVVCRPQSTPSWATLFDFGEGAENNTVDLTIDGATNTLVYDVHIRREREARVQVKAPGAVVPDRLQRFTVVHGGGRPGTPSAAAIYRNGQRVATGQATVPDASVVRASNFVGAGNWGRALYRGEIAEALVYAAALPEPERLQVERYLEAKYPHD